MKPFFQTLVKTVKLSINNRYFLLFSNGFLLALLLMCYLQADYESQLFKSLAQYVQGRMVTNPDSKEGLLIESLHVTHELGKNRKILFGTKAIDNPQAQLLKPLTYDLMTGQQACGGFSYVLARLLQEMKIETRFAQMQVNKIYGGHIVLEAKMPYGWVVVDPLFDLYFTMPDKRIASFAEVRSNWNEFKNMVPKDYDASYAYEDVRYTNWEKIPVILPAIKNIMLWSRGKEATESFSFRNLFLKKYEVLFYGLLVIYLAIFFLTIRSFFNYVRELASRDANLLFPKTSENAQKNQVTCQRVTFPSNL